MKYIRTAKSSMISFALWTLATAIVVIGLALAGDK